MKKLKIFNDPIYGFIQIESRLVFEIIQHPYFQRLRRISQMGLSYLVYPGGHHTRFEHALGCLFLMQKAISVLKSKGVEISNEEAKALKIAILLHDIGHGPFSHTLEHTIVKDVHHESISLKFMEKINEDFDGKLDLAIQIFKGEYHRPFFYQLIASQLDIDRLDYLRRDSFYCGVAEGNINSQRLISLLDVVDEQLVIDKKGIYSVEKFIVARRLMYWMVYLHKTSLVAENMLVNILKRAKYLYRNTSLKSTSMALNFFLENDISQNDFTSEILDLFSKLDDFDVISSVKSWMNADDYILSELCKSLINRKLPKIVIQNEPISEEIYTGKIEKVLEKLPISKEDLDYFIFKGKISNTAYNKGESPINIKFKKKIIEDIINVSDHFSLDVLTKPVTKHFFYYPR